MHSTSRYLMHLSHCRALVSTSLLSAMILFGSACGPDNKDSPNLIPGPKRDMGQVDRDQGDGNKDDMDGGPGDMGADSDTPDGGGDGDMGDMGPVSTSGLCANVSDLGTLPISDGFVRLTGSTRETTVLNQFATQCGSGAAPEVGWSFTVDQPVGIASNIVSAGIAWVIELHEGGCEQPMQRFCDANLDTNFFLEPGKEYVLIAEPRQNQRGELTIQLDFTPLVCLPVGETSCNGDDLDICAQGGAATITRSCASPCNMDACGGDMCENAITVDTLPYTFSGSVEGYFDRVNFDAENSCLNPNNAVVPGGPDDPDQPDPEPVEPGEPTGRIKTPGQDMTFLVQDLKQGDKLFIDVSSDVGDTADNVIFILDSCDMMSCHIAVDLGDKIEGWEVPADGDYVVIVDRTTDQDNDFAISISKE